MSRLFPIVGFLVVVILFGAYWSRYIIPQPSSSLPTLMPAESPSESNIQVLTPEGSATLSLPFTISGEAKVFENMLAFRIKDTKDVVLQEGYLEAKSPDVGMFGPFSKEITWVKQTPEKQAIIEVFSNSPKDGAEINTVTIPVNLKLDTATSVKSYFNKEGINDCETVYPLERMSANTSSVYANALRILLFGPLSSEKTEGYFSSINTDSSFKTVSEADGVVTVDFNKNIDEDVAGSCRVFAIRTQIEQTLKQYPAVTDVKISVEGDFEEALQP